MNEELRRVGYLRMFEHDQNPGMQEAALQQAGCDPTNIHQGSGHELFAAPTARRQLLDLLHNGDELIVYRLDRLSRDEHTLTNLAAQLQAMGVTLIVAPDTSTGDDNDK